MSLAQASLSLRRSFGTQTSVPSPAGKEACILADEYSLREVKLVRGVGRSVSANKRARLIARLFCFCDKDY